MTDRSLRAVEEQIRAMGMQEFELGLFTPANDRAQPEMLPRAWDTRTVLRSVSWLKFQNLQGRNIYIRPKGEHVLTLVDDLKIQDLTRMKEAGFAPALIVETSPHNFQAWLNHGRILARAVSSAAARSLAEEFGGDRGSADWRHFGRLAGFTNRKEKHRQEDGLFPFVRLIDASGEVYPMAPEFLRRIEEMLETSAREAERRRIVAMSRPRSTESCKTIEDFRGDPRYGGDGNRVDLAYAVYALAHGVAEVDVRAAISSRDLSHKGNESRQTDYLNRTIQKALNAARQSDRGR